MLFVDGENFTIRGQKLAADKDVKLEAGDNYIKNTYLWIPGIKATQNLVHRDIFPLQPQAVRAHYYASAVGDEPRLMEVSTKLWERGFTPHVFKKDKDSARTKAVDIKLTTDMLSNAFMNNYDVAVLFAGDGDYVPLLEEVARLGKQVHVMFFPNHGMSPALRLASDTFHHIDDLFVEHWSAAVTPPGEPAA